MEKIIGGIFHLNNSKNELRYIDRKKAIFLVIIPSIVGIALFLSHFKIIDTKGYDPLMFVLYFPVIFLFFLLIYPIEIRIIKKDKSLKLIKRGSFFMKKEIEMSSKDTKIVGTSNRWSPANSQINFGKHKYFIKFNFVDKTGIRREIDLYPRLLYFTFPLYMFTKKDIGEIADFLKINKTLV